MSWRQLIVTWILLSVLHFIGAFVALGYGFGAVVDWFFGVAQPVEAQELVWAIGKVLFQPGDALRQIFGAKSSFSFWLTVVLNSALWGLVLTFLINIIRRRASRKHAF
jgi:hypothetical protein